MEEWKQERPKWCSHQDCEFLRRTMDDACGGKLPIPQPHDSGGVPVNTHRVCMNIDGYPDTINIHVCDSDLDWLRWIFDALDGKKTSWLSKGK